MKAYQCDICGKLFVHNENLVATGLVICNRKYYSGSGDYNEYLADVCPECNNAFHKLMNKLKENGNDQTTKVNNKKLRYDSVLPDDNMEVSDDLL